MAIHHHITITKVASVALVAFLLTFLALSQGKDGQNVIHAFLGGLLPALFWLWFWLHEDSLHPEPKKIIFRAFFLGMVAVPFAIFFEQLYMGWRYPASNGMSIVSILTFADLCIWALIEETLKYGMAFFAGIRSQYFDEPIDAVMYLISAAIGFAALENMLFIFNALSTGALSDGFITSQLRFIGASLLHVASSALLGFGIGFGLSVSKWKRAWYFVMGMFGAFALHTSFNYFIILTNGGHLLEIFSLLWIVILFIIFLFEKIKRLPPLRVSEQT